MRQFTLILSAILAFTLLAASCGSDDDATEVSSDASADDGDDATAEPDDNSTADGEEPVEEPDDDAGLPLGAGPYPIADLTFVVDATETEEEPVTYRLACLGDTATFTGDSGSLDASTACASLTEPEVRDRLTTDQHLERMCTEIYGGPQLAQITGTLDDAPIDTTIDRANGCGIDDWDRLLALLLPPATP